LSFKNYQLHNIMNQLLVLNSRILNLFRILVLILFIVFILSCSKKDEDSINLINFTIVEPIENDEFAIGDSILIRINLSEDTEISRIELSVNGDFIDTIESDKLIYNWSSINMTEGSHTISIKTKDKNQNALSKNLKINLVDENKPPFAYYSVLPEYGDTTTVFRFDANGSYDFQDESEVLEFRWDFDNNGIWDTDWSTIKTSDHKFRNIKIYKSRLSVRNSKGLVSDYILSINVSKDGTFGSFIDYRDNQTYATITIGSQVWMAENLKYLPQVNPPSEISESIPYYYVYSYKGNNIEEAKNTENFKKYGVLYNYEAAVLSSPEGWHIPTDEEWKTLESFLGMSESELNELGSRGTNQGNKLKSDYDWDDNGAGSNSSKFCALPGGHVSSNSFYHIKIYGFWWSTSLDSYRYPWYRHLNPSDYVLRMYCSKDRAFSIRCIKD